MQFVCGKKLLVAWHVLVQHFLNYNAWAEIVINYPNCHFPFVDLFELIENICFIEILIRRYNKANWKHLSISINVQTIRRLSIFLKNYLYCYANHMCNNLLVACQF